MPSDTFLIELKDLRFHAFHGLYPEEKKKGGQFVVDLAVEYHPYLSDSATSQSVTIADTIDYSLLFEICQKAMLQPTELLENIALGIAKKIQTQFTKASRIVITIKKCNPPIPGCTGSSLVTYSWRA